MLIISHCYSVSNIWNRCLHHNLANVSQLKQEWPSFHFPLLMWTKVCFGAIALSIIIIIGIMNSHQFSLTRISFLLIHQNALNFSIQRFCLLSWNGKISLHTLRRSISLNCCLLPFFVQIFSMGRKLPNFGHFFAHSYFANETLWTPLMPVWSKILMSCALQPF